MQFLQIFFYLKYLLGWEEFIIVLRCNYFLRMRDIFFFSFYSLSKSSSRYSLLNRIVCKGRFKLLPYNPLVWSSKGCWAAWSSYDCVLWRVLNLMCYMIWPRICYFSFYTYYGGKFRANTSYLAKSEGDILSLFKSQSNFSFNTVF